MYVRLPAKPCHVVLWDEMTRYHVCFQDKDGTQQSAYMYTALGNCSHPYSDDDYSWNDYKAPRHTGLFGQIYRLHSPLKHDEMRTIREFKEQEKSGFRRMVVLMGLVLELYQTSSDAKFIMDNTGKQERWSWYVRVLHTSF